MAGVKKRFLFLKQRTPTEPSEPDSELIISCSFSLDLCPMRGSYCASIYYGHSSFLLCKNKIETALVTTGIKRRTRVTKAKSITLLEHFPEDFTVFILSPFPASWHPESRSHIAHTSRDQCLCSSWSWTFENHLAERYLYRQILPLCLFSVTVHPACLTFSHKLWTVTHSGKKYSLIKKFRRGKCPSRAVHAPDLRLLCHKRSLMS